MPTATIESLCDVLGFSDQHGLCPTCIPEVTLFRASHHEPSCPQKYDSGLSFILQGSKVGQISGRTFRTGSGRFLILTNSCPILCETFASAKEPLLGLHIRFDMAELVRLTQVIDAQRQLPRGDETDASQALISCPMNDELRTRPTRPTAGTWTRRFCLARTSLRSRSSDASATPQPA